MKIMGEGLRLSEIITVKTSEYVESLDGRYRKFTTDGFLIFILAINMRNRYEMQKYNKSLVQAAYEAGVTIFETVLEIGLFAGGNGHHVAQGYADMFKDVDNEPKPAA